MCVCVPIVNMCENPCLKIYLQVAVRIWLQDFEGTVDAQRNSVKQLIHSGMYLRYFSRKTDAITTVGKELPHIYIHWRRLLLRLSKIRHSLERAYQESRRVITF
jgi:hypothetical protein